MLCPFLIIAEYNFQAVYGQSYISLMQNENTVITRLIDNIAEKHPTIENIPFKFTKGLLHKIEK